MPCRAVLLAALLVLPSFVSPAFASPDLGELTPCSELPDAFAQHREAEVNSLVLYELSLIADFDGQIKAQGMPPLLPTLDRNTASQIGFFIARVCAEHPDYTVRRSTLVVYEATRLAKLLNKGGD